MWSSIVKIISNASSIANRLGKRKYKKKVLKLRRLLYKECHKPAFSEKKNHKANEVRDDKKIFDYINELNRIIELFSV